MKFDENTLYGLDELREQLKGTVELSTFLDRLGLRDHRVFRDALWGWEILDAAHRAKPFNEANIVVVSMTQKGAKPKGSSASSAPAGRLSVKDLRAPNRIMRKAGKGQKGDAGLMQQPHPFYSPNAALPAP